MSAAARARQPPAPPFIDPPGYSRHRPERTLLYQLVEQHYPAFRELRAAADRPLPDFVQQEFDAYLKCGRLEEGFLRVRCEQCHAEKLVAFSCKKRGFCPSCGGRRMAETAALLADEVLPERPLRQWVLSLPHALRFLLATDPDALTLVLGVVYRTVSGYLIGKAALTRATGVTGAVTLVQRFGSALNLNVHFHMVFLDGAYQTAGADAPVFHPVPAPESSDLQELVEQIAGRIGRALEGRGLVERDLENAWLATDTEAGPLDDLLGHSITYRIAVGPRAGQKLFTLRMVPPRLQGLEGEPLKIIASIEEAQLIAKILSHLERAVAQQSQSELALVARGPPVQSSLL
jgi:ribosomal protein S27E